MKRILTPLRASFAEAAAKAEQGYVGQAGDRYYG